MGTSILTDIDTQYDTNTVDKKSLLILVPDFDNDPVGAIQGKESTKLTDPMTGSEVEVPYGRKGRPMSSFLQMGTFSDENEQVKEVRTRSWNLAKYALIAPTAQGGKLSDLGGIVDISAENMGIGADDGVFLDDQRDRDGDDYTIPRESRLEQSKVLLTRGGWWDHSDGNRVSTTYGDKVEVVRGNYKMVILGRQDDPNGAATFDASGGVIQDGYSVFGGAVRIEIRKEDEQGRWHFENSSVGSVQTDDYAGDKYSHDWGDIRYSTTGSESGSVEQQGQKFGNPHIKDHTWAKKIESYTGSAKRPIPEILDETHAEVIRSITNAGAATEIKNFGASTEIKNIGTKIETTTAGVAVEVSIIGTKTEVEMVAGVKTSFEAAAVALEASIHGGKVEFSLCGGKVSANIGPEAEFNVGPRKELRAGSNETTELMNKVTTLENSITTVRDSVTSLKTKITSGSVDLVSGKITLGI